VRTSYSSYLLILGSFFAVGAAAIYSPSRGTGHVVALPDHSMPIHYAPAENLERIDVDLIDRAEHSIDMAAYVLTDWPVIQALSRAAGRGVTVRVYLDPSQLSHDQAGPFRELAATSGVEMRVKRGDVFMHLKSYAIDGRTLRTGAANFSASGEKRQDNDLVVIQDTESAAAFEREFESMFASGVEYAF
jgi:phosphatidylserine/phosphatidylglycerophosphate/cardiolipin synthase-like enzyme